MVFFVVLFLAVCAGHSVLAPLRSAHRHGRREDACATPAAAACLNATANAFEETLHPAVFSVRIAPRSTDTLVRLALSNRSTAVLGHDIRSFPTQLLIPAGQSVGTVKVYPYDDGNDREAPVLTIILEIVEPSVLSSCAQNATALLFKRTFLHRLLASLFSPFGFLSSFASPVAPAASTLQSPDAAAPAQTVGAAEPPVPSPQDFFDVCRDGQDCDISEPGTYVTLTLPVSPQNAAKSFGFITVHLGATLEVLVNNATSVPRSDYTLRCRSLLVVDSGVLRVGYSNRPFGTDGSTFTIQLYGSEANVTAITCPSDSCGAPNISLWSHDNVLYPNPSLPSGSDYFYRYFPLVFEPSNSRNYFGRKVLAVGYGGNLHLHGAMGAFSDSSVNGIAGSRASWSRVKNPVMNGTNIEFEIENSADFQASWFPSTKFRAILTTTDWYVSHNEVINVTRTNRGTFVADLIQYPHLGKLITLDPAVNSNITRRSGDFRAVFGVLDRSIRITSAGDTPDSSPTSWGGHTIFRQGARSVKISGVLFEKLGQGGLKGRYPFHAHMMRVVNNTNALYLRDSTVYDSNTRMVTIHGTHNATVERVVGFECFGHAFYLEDGAEIFNRIAWNVAAFAKSGFVSNGGPNGYSHNPRNNSGIFAHPGDKFFRYPVFSGPTVLADAISLGWLSDYLNPTLFWIRNGYNYVLNNVAVGAEFSGVCYWFIPSPMNHPSAGQRWNNTHPYAYLQQPIYWQTVLYGSPSAGQSYQMESTPTLIFDGNSGSTCSAMIMSIPDYGSNALNKGYAIQFPNDIYDNKTGVSLPVQWAQSLFNTKYNYAMNNEYCSSQFGCDWEFPQPMRPNTTLDSQPSWCPDNAKSTAECLQCAVKPQNGNICSNGILAVSNFTGSFGFTEVNFATMWFRTQFFLLTDSWMGDIVGGGVNFANSGDPTGVAIGFWGLVYRSVFIGSTQSQSIYADFRGPITPEVAAATGRRCVKNPPNLAQLGSDLCVLPETGQVFSYNVAAISQHFLHIYDGPMSAVDCHFANITANVISCPGPYGPLTELGSATPWCQKAVSKNGNDCINPNAAIGWKQPNGFDYPPGYLMLRLSFSNVDLHHHVYLPQFQSGTFLNDIAGTTARFCAEMVPPVDLCPRTNSCNVPCPEDFCQTSNQCGVGQLVCLDSGAYGQCNPQAWADPIKPCPPNPNCVDCPPFPNCANCCNSLNCVNATNFPTSFLTWSTNWNTIDRQTNLKVILVCLFDEVSTDSEKEMDGSISFRKTSTGYPGFIINKDVFFYGPNAESECSSLDTSFVVPHHYGRVYMLNDNWRTTESCRTYDDNHHCQVVRFHRLSYENSSAELPIPPVISAGPKGGMGQMFMEGTKYLIELLENPSSGCSVPDSVLVPANAIYYLQMLYPTSYAFPSTFVVYVGGSFQTGTDFSFCRFDKVGDQISRPLFCIQQQNWAANTTFPWLSNFIKFNLDSSGFLTVTVDHRVVPAALWEDGMRERCVPSPFCQWDSVGKKCGCGSTVDPALADRCNDICSSHGGVANAECPGGGCMGFRFHVPPNVGVAPYNSNATAWLQTNKQYMEQWAPEIAAQTFIGPPIGNRPCPSSV